MRLIPPNFASLTLFLMAAIAAGPARAQNPPQAAETDSIKLDGSAQQYFERMIVALESRRSIAAKVRYRIDQFGQSLVGSGVYLQQSLATGPASAAERALRFELKTQVGNQTTSLLQIGDGSRFWMYDESPSGVSLSTIDLVRLRRGLESQPTPMVSPTAAWMALGGLPRLAQGISQSFEFSTVKPARLEQFPVLALAGEWKRARLAEIAPEQKEAILAGKPIDPAKLPRHVPERIVLLIGRSDLFPYRVEFWRRQPASRSWTLKAAPPVDTLLMALEFYEVQTDAPLDPRQFAYNPGSLPKVDKTDLFLQSFGLKDEPQATRPPAGGRH